MNAVQNIETRPDYPILKEAKIDPMWSADEDERRAAIIRRASEGARKALRGK